MHASLGEARDPRFWFDHGECPVPKSIRLRLLDSGEFNYNARANSRWFILGVDYIVGYDKTRVVKSEEIDHLVMERGVRCTWLKKR